MKHDWTRGEAWGKSSAAVLGGFLVFLFFGLALGAALPLAGMPTGGAVALGVVGCVPVWALAAGGALLAGSGRAAWGKVGGAALVLALVAAAAKLL